MRAIMQVLPVRGSQTPGGWRKVQVHVPDLLPRDVVEACPSQHRHEGSSKQGAARNPQTPPLLTGGGGA